MANQMKRFGDGTESPVGETEGNIGRDKSYLGVAQEHPVMPGVVAVCVNGHAVLRVEDSTVYTPGCFVYGDPKETRVLTPDEADALTDKVKVGVVVPPTWSNRNFLSILIAH